MSIGGYPVRVEKKPSLGEDSVALNKDLTYPPKYGIMVRVGGLLCSYSKLCLVCFFVISVLCGLFADEGSAELGLHRAFLVLTVVFGFLLTWSRM